LLNAMHDRVPNHLNADVSDGGGMLHWDLFQTLRDDLDRTAPGLGRLPCQGTQCIAQYRKRGGRFVGPAFDDGRIARGNPVLLRLRRGRGALDQGAGEPLAEDLDFGGLGYQLVELDHDGKEITPGERLFASKG